MAESDALAHRIAMLDLEATGVTFNAEILLGADYDVPESKTQRNSVADAPDSIDARLPDDGRGGRH